MKKQEISTETKKNLEEVFWKLYAQKPINKITIGELTDLAGYNRGTFYLYYQDIYDMLSHVEDAVIQRLQDNMPTVNAEEYQKVEKTWETVFPLIVANAEKMYEMEGEHMTILLSAHANMSFYNRLKQEMLDVMKEIMKEIEPDTKEAEMDYILHFYVSGILDIVTTWHRNECDISSDEMVRIIARVCGALYPTSMLREVVWAK
jgi:AcrR family transcriptional regulator